MVKSVTKFRRVAYLYTSKLLPAPSPGCVAIGQPRPIVTQPKPVERNPWLLVPLLMSSQGSKVSQYADTHPRKPARHQSER